MFSTQDQAELAARLRARRESTLYVVCEVQTYRDVRYEARPLAHYYHDGSRTPVAVYRPNGQRYCPRPSSSVAVVSV